MESRKQILAAQLVILVEEKTLFFGCEDSHVPCVRIHDPDQAASRGEVFPALCAISAFVLLLLKTSTARSEAKSGIGAAGTPPAWNAVPGDVGNIRDAHVFGEKSHHAVSAGYNPQVGTLDKCVQGSGNKQSQHGFPISHRFFHENAVYQLEETIFMIVQSEHVPFGCLSRRRPEPDAKWRNITQLLKQISHGERQRWGNGSCQCCHDDQIVVSAGEADKPIRVAETDVEAVVTLDAWRDDGKITLINS